MVFISMVRIIFFTYMVFNLAAQIYYGEDVVTYTSRVVDVVGVEFLCRQFKEDQAGP
jgi:hypothetical protein